MKVLVVGSTSVIGRTLASRFRAIADVKMAGRRDADFVLDLSDCNMTSGIGESFDVIVHAAASFGGNSDEDFLRAEQVNAVGTLSVCALAQQVHAKHVVLISSLFAAYCEGDPYYGIYALSKRHGEEAARLFCAERGLPLTILRPSQVYDATGACRRHQPLLYAIADCARTGDDVHLYGSNDALRNYLFLDDLVEICSRVVEKQCKGTFVCAYPAHVRLSEVAEAAFAAFGHGGTTYFDADKPDQHDLPPITDFTLYDEIAYRPTTDIRMGFEKMRDHNPEQRR